MAAHTSDDGPLRERRDRWWNGMFWVTIAAFEVVGWFLSHRA